MNNFNITKITMFKYYMVYEGIANKMHLIKRKCCWKCLINKCYVFNSERNYSFSETNKIIHKLIWPQKIRKTNLWRSRAIHAC